MTVWDTASAAIDAAFAVPGGVTFVGPDLSKSIEAIRLDQDAPEFMGADSAISIGYEIAMSALPRRPKKGDLLLAGADRWGVLKVHNKPAISKWWVWVEAVP